MSQTLHNNNRLSEKETWILINIFFSYHSQTEDKVLVTGAEMKKVYYNWLQMPLEAYVRMKSLKTEPAKLQQISPDRHLQIILQSILKNNIHLTL